MLLVVKSILELYFIDGGCKFRGNWEHATEQTSKREYWEKDLSLAPGSLSFKVQKPYDVLKHVQP